jgi:hypothetical protein
MSRSREYLHEAANIEPDDWAQVLQTGFERFSTQPIAARNILEIAQELNVLPEYWTGCPEQTALRNVGQAMYSVHDRIFGGYTLTPITRHRTNKSRRYTITPPPSPAYEKDFLNS